MPAEDTFAAEIEAERCRGKSKRAGLTELVEALANDADRRRRARYR